MFDASNLAASVKGATVQNIIEANKVIHKVKSEEVALKFQFLGDENALELVIFSDASLGNLPDGHFIMNDFGEKWKIFTIVFTIVFSSSWRIVSSRSGLLADLLPYSTIVFSKGQVSFLRH